jgi:hypothetical protein
MHEATLVLWHKGTPANQRIIKFMDSMLPQLAQAGVKFDFQIAYQEDKEHYMEQGITALPYLQVGNTQLASVDKIIPFLRKLMTQRPSPAKPKADPDNVRDFMLKSINAEDSDDDDDDMSNFRTRMSEEIDRRGTMGVSRGAEEPKVSVSRGHKAVRNPQPSRPSRDTQPTINPPSQSVRPPPRPARKDNIDPKVADVVASLKHSSGDQKRDDDLMARFFESQEVTAI